MSKHAEILQKTRERFCDKVKSKLDQWSHRIHVYDNGFWDGWHEAMKVKYDDREILQKWSNQSKSIYCPCNEEKSCATSCPHGRMWMSGVCLWCSEKFNEMEQELLTKKAEQSKVEP